MGLKEMVKSLFSLRVVSDGTPPKVQYTRSESDLVGDTDFYNAAGPDESLAPSATELLDVLALYPSLPYIFAGVNKIASSAALVPLRLYEATEPPKPDPNMPMEAPIPLGTSSQMPLAKRYYRRYSMKDLFYSEKQEVGGYDELSGYSADNLVKTPVSSHPFLELLKHPNSRQTTTEFFYAIYAYLTLIGNCYIILDTDEWGEIVSMQVPRPDRIEPKRNQDGERYYSRTLTRDGVVVVKRYEWDQVIHLRQFNPLSNIIGQGDLRPALASIFTDLFCIKYNQNFFLNSARPDLVISTEKGIVLDKVTRDRLKAEWDEMFKGVDKAKRPVVLEGGMEVKPLTAVNQEDMEFSKQRERNREDVLSALGVHPALVGIGAVNMNANELREYRRLFWEDTVLPKMARVAESLETYLFPRVHPFEPKILEKLVEYELDRSGLNVGALDSDKIRQAMHDFRMRIQPVSAELGKFSIEYDTRSVKALREAAAVESQVWMRLLQMGVLTINEVRAEMNRPPVDWGYKPAPMTIVGAAQTRLDNNEVRENLEPEHPVAPEDMMPNQQNPESGSNGGGKRFSHSLDLSMPPLFSMDDEKSRV